MNKKGPILFVDDDEDDWEILKNVFEDLQFNNELIFLKDGEEALEMLNTMRVEPFIIFSDLRLPKLTGMKLWEKVNENKALRIKMIPFVFFTTIADHKNVLTAFEESVQGFFIKPHNYKDLKVLMHTIMSYWEKSLSP